MIKLVKKILIKQGYFYLFFKVGVFLMLAFFFDFILGSFLSKFYFKQTSGWEYRTKYSIEDTKADILVFGASRAQQQYNPLFFEERLHQTCYNVGRDGQPIFYYYAVLKSIVKRYTPKMIILDIENEVFKEDQSSYDRISVLLPFYKNHPELHSIIEQKGPFEKFKLQSYVYPYNSMLFKIAIGNTEFNKKRNIDINGYVPLTRVLDEQIRNVDLSKKYVIDSIKINLYQSFINECLRANIKLYIVCSPYFFNSIGSDTSMQLATEIAKRNNIDYFDFSKDKLFLNNSKFFDDTVHVNVEGSKIFTNKLIDSIILKSP
jgi:hypothetical protein